MTAIKAFRQAFFKTTRQGIFFDNASMGPVSPAVTEAMSSCMELRESMPMKYYQYADRIFPQCRARLAALIHAAPEEIAFTENVAYGINCAANALPLSPGDNVILCDREFSSNVYPWLLLERTKQVQARLWKNTQINGPGPYRSAVWNLPTAMPPILQRSASGAKTTAPFSLSTAPSRSASFRWMSENIPLI